MGAWIAQILVGLQRSSKRAAVAAPMVDSSVRMNVIFLLFAEIDHSARSKKAETGTQIALKIVVRYIEKPRVDREGKCPQRLLRSVRQMY